MRIDRTHRPWLLISTIVFVVSTLWYVYYVTRGSGALNGPSGSSFPGLTFGIAGTLCMLFAGLLGMRKKVRTWRIGSAQFWMRGHLWLGALALPLIWYHAGFRHGGTMTSLLMWITYAIVASGIVGAVLQHVLPTRMTQALPNETVYEQIDRVSRELAIDAEHVAAVCGPTNGIETSTWRAQCEAAIGARYERSLLSEERKDRLLAGVRDAPLSGSAPLRTFYVEQIRPYVRGEASVATLDDPGRAESIFAQQRLAIPRTLHVPLDELHQICDQVRQLRQQKRLQHWLHGWLLIHVPLSMALLVLAVAHIIVALRYAL